FTHGYPITEPAERIIPALNELNAAARAAGMPVIHSTDSFLEDDFIFKGKMKPHSLRGTPGAEVVDGVVCEPSDVWLPKRRFSAFYKTDLDQTLRTWGVEQVAVGGIVTHVCVLATALDALQSDFRTIIVEDCCASPTEEMRTNCLDLYRNGPLDPLFRVINRAELIGEWS
ncbi:MAG: cysteine hydrolase, partial [Proteobacteria bacterium]|nr:cysteine hydrolase [Pseudomonadota bacterium]